MRQPNVERYEEGNAASNMAGAAAFIIVVAVLFVAALFAANYLGGVHTAPGAPIDVRSNLPPANTYGGASGAVPGNQPGGPGGTTTTP